MALQEGAAVAKQLHDRGLVERRGRPHPWVRSTRVTTGVARRLATMRSR